MFFNRDLKVDSVGKLTIYGMVMSSRH